MKSYWIVTQGEQAVLERREVPQPHPKPGEIVLKVHASALNRGELIVGGVVHGGPAKIGGNEASGVVQAIGEGVAGIVVGDKVMGRARGAFAEYALMDAHQALPIPSSLVMVLSGAAFGVAWGSLVALVGSISGEWIGFELVRRYGRGVSRGIVGADEFERFSAFFDRHGILAVMLTRPLPVVMETMSLVAGLSTMSRTAFLGASLAGTAPIVVIYAYAGAVSRQVDSIVPAVVILVAVSACGYAWYRAKFAAADTVAEVRTRAQEARGEPQ